MVEYLDSHGQCSINSTINVRDELQSHTLSKTLESLQVNKLINETFKSLASPALAHHKPMFVIDFQIPRHT